MTFDTVTLIGTIFGVLAILYGLLSRNFGTAVVAGLFLGIIHAGLVALAVVQSGSAIGDLPFFQTAAALVLELHRVSFLKDGLDLAMSSPYLGMPPARLAAYLTAGALALMLTMIVLYLVKAALASLFSVLIPKKA